MNDLFSADAETDGLYGPVWAVGAVARIHPVPNQSFTATFSGQLDPGVVTDEWTREHVVPVVDLPRYGTGEELLEAFWEFWAAHRDGALAIADCGYPVESGLYRAAVELDTEARWNRGPFPLHELSTWLLACGLDPKLDRRAFIGRPDLTCHDPAVDAMVAALCWEQAAAGLPAAGGGV